MNNKSLTDNETITLDKFLTRYPSDKTFYQIIRMIEDIKNIKNFSIIIWNEYEDIERGELIEAIEEVDHLLDLVDENLKGKNDE